MSRELPTTTVVHAPAGPRSIIERERCGKTADGGSAGHALIARNVVWLERFTQMSRTRSCPNRRLFCLALESPPLDVAFEMPPIGTVSARLKWRNWYSAGTRSAPSPRHSGFLTAIGHSCTPENTLLLRSR